MRRDSGNKDNDVKANSEYPIYYLYDDVPPGHAWLTINGVHLVKPEYEEKFKEENRV